MKNLTLARSISWKQIADLTPKRKQGQPTTGIIMQQPEWKKVAGDPTLHNISKGIEGKRAKSRILT